jgi:hypothetical protein
MEDAGKEAITCCEACGGRGYQRRGRSNKGKNIAIQMRKRNGRD